MRNANLLLLTIRFNPALAAQDPLLKFHIEVTGPVIPKNKDRPIVDFPLVKYKSSCDTDPVQITSVEKTSRHLFTVKLNLAILECLEQIEVSYGTYRTEKFSYSQLLMLDGDTIRLHLKNNRLYQFKQISILARTWIDDTNPSCEYEVYYKNFQSPVLHSEDFKAALFVEQDRLYKIPLSLKGKKRDSYEKNTYELDLKQLEDISELTRNPAFPYGHYSFSLRNLKNP